MYRSLRFEYPGARYHLTSHRDGRVALCLSGMLRDSCIFILAHVYSRSNSVCHCLCLISDHYHLRVKAPEAYLAQVVRHFNSVLTQRFNRRVNLMDLVFQERDQEITVDKAAYLLELSHYIVLNIARSFIVKSARDWRLNRYGSLQALLYDPYK